MLVGRRSRGFSDDRGPSARPQDAEREGEWSCSECSHFLPSLQGGIDILKGPGMNFTES